MTRTNHTLVCVPDIFEEQKGEGLPIFSVSICSKLLQTPNLLAHQLSAPCRMRVTSM